MTINLIEAIVALDQNARVSVNETTGKIIWHCGNQKNISEEQIQAKLTELQVDYDSKQYQRDRAEAYPDLKEQLDLLWHAIDDGKFNVKSKETDFYKKLKAVKDANPKPE